LNPALSGFAHTSFTKNTSRRKAGHLCPGSLNKERQNLIISTKYLLPRVTGKMRRDDAVRVRGALQEDVRDVGVGSAVSQHAWHEVVVEGSVSGGETLRTARLNRTMPSQCCAAMH
jgi:hypothetical protein